MTADWKEWEIWQWQQRPIIFTSWPLFFFFFFVFPLFKVPPTAYAGSQARGQIRAIATGLHHSHSNAGSLTHGARPGIEPAYSWILAGFVNH